MNDDIMIRLGEVRFAFYPRKIWNDFVDDCKNDAQEYRWWWKDKRMQIIYLSPTQANMLASYLKTRHPKKYPILQVIR